MTPPEIRYASSSDLRIAYQVVGTGSLDLVFVPGFGKQTSAWSDATRCCSVMATAKESPDQKAYTAYMSLRTDETACPFNAQEREYIRRELLTAFSCEHGAVARWPDSPNCHLRCGRWLIVA